MKRLERQRKILNSLSEEKSITVQVLSEILNVSPRTIRYDIDELSLVYPITSIRGRYYGGVKLIAPLPHKKCLTDKQFNFLIKLKERASGEEYIILESIIFDFSLP